MNGTGLKAEVQQHWEHEVCGSRFGDDRQDRRAYFREIDRDRCQQDYMLADFARFGESTGRRVLEVGLGTGADFIRWVRAGATAAGRDLTAASVALVRERLELEGLHADVATGDAENLEFADNSFDIYYSWGVLHHTPNTERAIAEAWRVLRPAGQLRIMLYRRPSVAVGLVWLAQGPLRGRWVSPRTAVARYVESPGTSCYSTRAARAMVGRYFPAASIRTHAYMGSGDLLSIKRRSPRYQGRLWDLAQAAYPRWLVRRIPGPMLGSVLTIEATK